MMNKIAKYLKQPYPVPENSWRFIIPITFFVVIFLYVFQPFGLSNFNSNYKIFILLGYGLVTFLVQLLVLLVLPRFFKSFFNEKRWSLGLEYLLLLSILFLIGFGNFLYSVTVFNFEESFFRLFLIFQSATLVVGVFPVTLVLILHQNKLLRANMKEAEYFEKYLNNLNPKSNTNNLNTIILASDSTKDKIKVIPDDICFIESEGNYVNIIQAKDGNIKRDILRTTLKKLEDDLKQFKFIMRCHRAFMVNLNKIASVKGNAQGYRLKLINMDDVVLVSRSYVENFKNKGHS